MSMFHTMSIDHEKASQEQLIDACRSGRYPIIGGCEYGRLVVQISQHAVIKYGSSITASEAATQTYVYQNVDPSIFRVPKIFRFFDQKSDWGLIGYLVMEFVNGMTLDVLDGQIRSELSARLAKCLDHLWQIPIIEKEQPGPVGGGEPKGSIWSDDGACTVFETVLDMERWLNVSLENDEDLAKIGRWDFPDQRDLLNSLSDRLSLAGCRLVMCHGDFIGRNIILQENGTLYILDWGYAGFYPRFFDLYSLISNENRDPALLTPLLKYFVGLRATYARELQMLQRIQRANSVISRVPQNRQLDWSFDDLEDAPEPIWLDQPTFCHNEQRKS